MALDAATFGAAFIVILMALAAARQMAKGNTHPSLPVITLVGLVCGLPLMLDLSAGRLYLHDYPGFEVASRDPSTQWTFLGYVVITSTILWRWGGHRLDQYGPGTKRGPEAAQSSITLQSKTVVMQGLAACAMTATPVMVLLAPDPGIYSQFGRAALSTELTDPQAEFHAILSLVSVISVVGSLAFLSVTPKARASAVALVLPFLGIACWVNGKRAVVALAVVGVVFTLWQRGRIKGRAALAAATAAALGVIAFSAFYQSEIRPTYTGPSDSASSYTGTRIDYGRDQQIKMAIYSQLHPDRMQILDYPAQSLFYYATLYVPRSAWPDKPFTYSEYFTAALYRTSPGSLSWGMTTSWLGEAVSNLSWIGFLAGPLTLLGICRIGARTDRAATRLLTAVFGCLMVMLQLVAILPVAIIWVLSVLAPSKGASASPTAGREDANLSERATSPRDALGMRIRP